MTLENDLGSGNVVLSLQSNKRKSLIMFESMLCLKCLPVYLAIHGMKIVTCFFHFRLIAVFLEPRSQSFN